MAMTKLIDLVDPQVLADMIVEKLKAKISVIGYAKLDTTLEGRAGSKVSVPRRKFDGIAVEVAEGEAIPIRKLIDEIVDYAIKKAGIGTEVTDEVIESGLGDPVADSVVAIVNSILAKLDIDAMTELLKAGTILTDDGLIGYDSIVNGIDLFEEEEISDKVVLVHPTQLTGIRKDEAFIDRTKYGNEVMVTGEVGSIAGARVKPSKRVEGCGGYFYNPIIKLSGDPEVDEETPALTYYLKRDTNVEFDRKSRYRKTEITGDQMYVVALTNGERVVLVRTAGAPLKAKTFHVDLGMDTYNYDDVSLSTEGVNLKLGKVVDNATTLKISGEGHKIPASLNIEGYTHYSLALVEVPEAPLNADATKVKINNENANAESVEFINGVPYVKMIVALKNDNGTVVAQNDSFVLSYDDGAEVTFNVDVTKVKLA